MRVVVRMVKDVNNMSREELIELVRRIINEREFGCSNINKVSVCDVEVISNIESLDNCKQAVNDLIKHNEKFITLRQNKIKADNLGYFG
jgi:acetolactate synthase regulatory subunit